LILDAKQQDKDATKEDVTANKQVGDHSTISRSNMKYEI